MSPSPEIRVLRHELLNQVNHIVGYAELILEDLADGAGPADPALSAGLGDVCSAGKEVLAAVTAILDPAAEDFDAPALQAALADPLQRVFHLAGDLAGAAPEGAAEALVRIAQSAERAGALAAGLGGEMEVAADGLAAGVGGGVDAAGGAPAGGDGGRVEAAAGAEAETRADVGEAAS